MGHPHPHQSQEHTSHFYHKPFHPHKLFQMDSLLLLRLLHLKKNSQQHVHKDRLLLWFVVDNNQSKNKFHMRQKSNPCKFEGAILSIEKLTLASTELPEVNTLILLESGSRHRDRMRECSVPAWRAAPHSRALR